MSGVKPEVTNEAVDPKKVAVEVFLSGKPAVIADPVAPAATAVAPIPTPTDNAPDAGEEDFFGWSDDEKALAGPALINPVAADAHTTTPTVAPTVEKESHIVAIAKKLGIEATNEDDFVEAVRQKTTPIVIGGDETTQSINRLLASDDKTLVTEAMRNEGWKDEEISEYFDKSEDIHIKKEARTIRNGLSETLKNYSNQIEEQRKAADAKRQADIANHKNQLKDYLSKTDDFMGLKLGRTAEEVAANNNKLFDYVTSGRFEQKVFSSPENIRKAAWLFENAEAFAKANYNRGFNAAKKAVLGNMEVPDHAGMQPQTARPQEKKRDPNTFFDGIRKTN